MGAHDDDDDGGTVPPPTEPVPTQAPTAVQTPAAGRGGSLIQVPSIASAALGGADRYAIGELIGKGGMGEVMLATDVQIGRDVAIKRMRHVPSAQGYARFLREARIQGRLEHPAIVPVHELSVDPDGRPYFVMKRLSGTTLYDILDMLREGDPVAMERFPRQRLLRALVDVCLAVEFAHDRGVIHRDLKPANIVIGDFGEVYVLDWGVARVISGAGAGTVDAAGDLGSLGERMDGAPVTPSIETGSPGAPGPTEAGLVLGTPGYIPPEQIRGEATLDHRADVFALGCILFEILAHERLFPLGAPGLTAPFGEIDARPSRRAAGRDVPPELDALCMAATRSSAADRLASARSLADRLTSYLDGDRDVALRKRIADEHLAAALAALERSDGEDGRRTAMREAGRALALDPTAADAADLVGRLMLEPPAVAPAEVELALGSHDHAEIGQQASTGVIAFVLYLSFLPLLGWIGIRDGRELAAMAIAMVINLLLAALVARTRGRIARAWVHAAAIANCVLVALLSWLLGPFLVVPGLAAATVMAFSLLPGMRSGTLWVAINAAALAPLAFDLLAGRPGTVQALHGKLLLAVPALEVRTPHIEVGLVLYVVVLTGISALLASRIARVLRRTRRTLLLQAWHLRQLMPNRPATIVEE